MANRILLFVTSFLLGNTAFSQNFTFSFYRTSPNIAYFGMDNYFSCTVERASCKSVILSSDSGDIEKLSNCNYIFKPHKAGVSTILISNLKRSKTRKIGEWKVVVKEIPEPIVNIGGLSGGYIKKGALIAQGGIGSGLPHFLAIDVDYYVKKFTLSITREDKIIFNESYQGNAFTPDIKEAFKVLQKEDRILISSISVQLPDKSEVPVKPIEFIIQD